VCVCVCGSHDDLIRHAGVAVGDEGIDDRTEQTEHHDILSATLVSDSTKGPIRGIGTCGRYHGCLRDRVWLWGLT
jgi:hypothetical protein